MKKTVSVFLSVLFIITLIPFNTNAATDFIFTLSYDGAYYELVSYTANQPCVTIPSEYEGLPVGVIRSGALSGNVSVYKIVIPDSVKLIEEGAFTAMPSLYEFEADGSYRSVDGVLFSSDMKTLLRYPEAREGEYSVPESVKNIYGHAFSGANITAVKLNNAVNVGDSAFYMSKITTADFSLDTEYIEKNAFKYSKLKSVVIPFGTVVDDFAFSNCYDLEYADVSGARVAGIGVFSADAKLLAVKAPKSDTVIPEYTYAGCMSLVSAPVPSGTEYVDNYAFYGCCNLKYARLPDNAGYSDNAFQSCGDSLQITKGAYGALSVSKFSETVKTGEKYTGIIAAEGGYELLTSSYCVLFEDGEITGVREGEAIVYAVSKNGGDCIKITVNVNDGEELCGSDHPYGKGTKKYSVRCENAQRTAVTFSSSDMLAEGDVLTVSDKNGNVYARYTGGGSAGKTVVLNGDTANFELRADNGGLYGFRVVSVSDAEQTVRAAITVPASLSLDLYESAPLPVTFLSGKSDLLFFSSDSSVCHVDNKGNLTALKPGKATVSVYCTESGGKAECEVTAVDTSYNGFLYDMKNDGVYITGYNGVLKNLTVPEIIDSIPVLGIYENAFAYSDIRSVFIPASVLSVADTAFDGCSSLLSIDVSPQNYVFSSYDGVLYSADGSELIRVPCGRSGEFTIPDQVEIVCDRAFSQCYLLNGITVGKNVIYISGRAFEDCDNIESVNSDSDLYTVSGNALVTDDGGKLVYVIPGNGSRDFSVPDGTVEIAEYAICPTVENLFIPSSVEYIYPAAFASAYELSNIEVDVSNEFYRFEGGALYGGTTLVTVLKNTEGTFTVPSGINEICGAAFYECGKITDIVFPTTLRTVGEFAFARCYGLRNLYLPESVRTVKDNAFDGCVNLSVYFPDKASVGELNDIKALCSKNAKVYGYCVENCLPYELTYYSERGIYKTYSHYDAALIINESSDKTLLSNLRFIAGEIVNAYAVEYAVGEITLPGSEYVIFRSTTNRERYFTDGLALHVIKTDAESIYRIGADHVIELTGMYSGSKLALRSYPDKMKYGKGEVFDGTGMQLYYTKSNGNTVTVDEGWSAEYSFSNYGQRKVTVRYNSRSVEFYVIVSDYVLRSSVYTVDDENEKIKAVNRLTNVETFIGGFDEPGYLSVYRNGEQLGNSAAVCTGDSLMAVQNGAVVYCYMIVVTYDINGDGDSNNKDIISLFRYLSAYEDSGYVYGDTNNDGRVDNKDVIELFRALS